MQPIRSYPRRLGVRKAFSQTVITLTLLLSLAQLLPAATQAANRPTLQIDAPQRVEVGQPIVLTLALKQVDDIAGYEANLLFDPAAAHFNELLQRKNDLKRFKRDISPIGPLLLPNGVSFGLYSCPTDDCVKRAGAKQRQGGKGTVKLAHVALVADVPGTLEFRLGAAKFVDAAGMPVAVAIPDEIIRVQVGAANAGPLFRAPASPWQLAQNSNGAKKRTDISGDTLVTNADAMSVALSWELARTAGAPCKAAGAADINADGCVDIADLQLVAANYSDADAKRSSAASTQARSTSATSNAVQSVAEDDTMASPAPSAQASTAAVAVVPAGPITFVVNTTADDVDATIGDAVCATAAGLCSLRAAIEEANRHPGADTVAFNIPGSGVQTINITSQLPIINDESGALTIDGYTQPGAAANTDALVSNARIMVQLQGPGQNVTFPGLFVTSSNNVIRGLSFFKFWRSIWLSGSGANNNLLAGNFVGTDATGTYRATSWMTSANGGILLDQGASYNKIGTPTLADRNVVSGNPASGVYLTKEQTNYNLVQNNIMGLNPLGTKALGNILEGVDLNFSVAYNLVGGTGPKERNVMSGGDKMGVELSHGTMVNYNQVVGNFVGTDVTGTKLTSFSPNGQCGIHVEDGVGMNTVAYNVVGGNGAQNNVGNKPSGGICVNGVNTRNNTIANNWIGVTPGGVAIPNKNFGLEIRFAAYGTVVRENVIANNPAGLLVREGDNDGNTLSRNAIYNNGTTPGIDLQPIGTVNPNDIDDVDTGANEQLSFPALSSASTAAVKGIACANCVIEVFKSAGAANQFGPGRSYINSATADANGRFAVAVSGLAAGDYVTSTATDSLGNTSEFSRNMPVFADTAPDGASFAVDTFARSSTDSWGSASCGGPYTLTGAVADYDVNGYATMQIGAAGATRIAHLLSVAPQDVDASVRLSTTKPASGGNQFAYIVLRRLNNSNEYRANLRFAVNGSVWAQITRVSNGSQTAVGPERQVPGLVYTAGTSLRMRVQAVGSSPTTLRMKVWTTAQAEPVDWLSTVTDSTPSLQSGGTVALRAYLGSTSTSAPVVFNFDDFSVVSASLAYTSALPSTPTCTTP